MMYCLAFADGRGGRGGGVVGLGAATGSICLSMHAAHCYFSRLLIEVVQHAFAAQRMAWS